MPAHDCLLFSLSLNTQTERTLLKWWPSSVLYSVLWTVCSLSCLFRPAWWWHFTSLFGSSLDSTVLLLDHSSTTTTTIPTISIGSGMRPLLLNCELCSSSDAALHHHQHSAPQLDCLFSFSFSPFCLSLSLSHSLSYTSLTPFVHSLFGRRTRRLFWM